MLRGGSPSVDIYEGDSFYSTVQFDPKENTYACLGYKIGSQFVLKFAATTHSKAGLEKLKTAINDIQENPQTLKGIN